MVVHVADGHRGTGRHRFVAVDLDDAVALAGRDPREHEVALVVDRAGVGLEAVDGEHHGLGLAVAVDHLQLGARFGVGDGDGADVADHGEVGVGGGVERDRFGPGVIRTVAAAGRQGDGQQEGDGEQQGAGGSARGHVGSIPRGTGDQLVDSG